MPVKWLQCSEDQQGLEERAQLQKPEEEEEVGEKHSEKDADQEQSYRHVCAAITAIVSEDLEFFTPPPEQAAETQTPGLTELKEEKEEEEEGEHPVTNGTGGSAQPAQSDNRPLSLPSPREFPRLTSSGSTFSRSTSVQSPSVYSPGARQSQRFSYYFSHGLSQRPPMYRSLSVQPQMYGKVFGSNRQNVERILQRMADAIRMDLDLRQ